MTHAFLITLLGAPGSGKSTLAAALVAALRQSGLRSVLIAAPDLPIDADDTTLQAAVATGQAQAWAQAAAGHDVIVQDSPALQLAALAGCRRADATVPPWLEDAVAAQRRADLSLLMALDRPAPADAARARQRRHDQWLRGALLQAGLGWSVIAGDGPARLQAALAARAAELRRRQAPVVPPGRWRHACGRCGDPDCERHLFAALLQPAGRGGISGTP